MKAQFVYENVNFERGLDPKSSIGIGLRSQIEKWMKKVKIDPEDYTIDENFNIVLFTPENLVLTNTPWVDSYTPFAANAKVLSIYDYTKIDYIPENMTVYGGVFMAESKIASIPSTFKPLSYLDLRFWKGTSLPDNFTVGDNLDISGSLISSWPKKLTVGGDLFIKDTYLSGIPLPKDLVVKTGRIVSDESMF
jgi:hypothetical protein